MMKNKGAGYVIAEIPIFLLGVVLYNVGFHFPYSALCTECIVVIFLFLANFSGLSGFPKENFWELFRQDLSQAECPSCRPAIRMKAPMDALMLLKI